MNETPTIPLTPYLEAVATSQNPGSARAVVLKLLQDADIFAGYDQVKVAVGTNTDEKLSATLDLFSYGILEDYQKAPDTFVTLTEHALAKLRQLTALSLIEDACAQRQNSVPYSAIQAKLQLTNARETEQILQQLLAAGVVFGKLSQKRGAFLLQVGDVSATTTSGGTSSTVLIRPRDVHPNKVQQMIRAIQHMRGKCDKAGSDLQQQQSQVLRALEQEKESLAHFNNSNMGGDYDMRGGIAASRRQSQKRSRGGYPNSIQEATHQVGASRPFGV